MARVDKIIKFLDLIKHPEGGYFKETYRSEEVYESNQGSRNLSTNIYFLLKSGQKSAFHRLKSDEFWYYHEGSSLEVFIIHPDGKLEERILGGDCLSSHEPQLLLPKGTWFAARCKDESSYTLISCSVAPGFHFDDFELAERKELQNKFPQFHTLIAELT